MAALKPTHFRMTAELMQGDTVITTQTIDWATSWALKWHPSQVGETAQRWLMDLDARAKRDAKNLAGKPRAVRRKK